MTLLDTFGVDIKIVLAQLVSFSVFFWVLYRYGITPTLTMLEKRKNKIAKELSEAKRAKEAVSLAEEEKETILRKAKKEAAKIIEEGRERSKKFEERATNQAKEDAVRIIEETKEEILQEKEKMLKEVKKSLSNLVLKTTEKILGNEISEEINNKVSEEYINRMLNQ
jgi:F-type H+-transporting ATPase subunit b